MASAGEMQQGMPAVMHHQHLGGHLGVVDTLTCQWAGCTERCESPEALYEHVCERHVGRKSTNNLNLQCQWGSCRTTTVKRDHITSHIRVHVPLKPHKCDFCGKSFKRPQDLKKHVKTHADESVLLRTPDPGAPQRSQGSSYQQNGNKGSYYSQDGQMHTAAGAGSYNFPQGGQAQMSYSMPQASGHYGSVYYNNPQGSSYTAGLSESKKRTHDALNEFFGDIKKRQIDPSQYQDLGARLHGLMNMPMGMSPGYQAGFQAGIQAALEEGGTAVAYGSHPPGFQTHAPFPELRSKGDLMSIDHFLEQLQNTVYEHPQQYSQQQYHQIPIQVKNTGVPMHTTADLNTAGTSPYSSAYNPASIGASTPDLTPSSAHASQSPASVHATHHSNGNVLPPASGSMYPPLPPVSTLDRSYPTGAPPSNIGSNWEEYEGHKLAGILQRAPVAEKEPKSKEATPTPADKTERPTLPGIESVEKGTTEEDSEKETSAKEDRQEAWVQNMRLIEALRDYVHRRLEKGDFASEPEKEKDKDEDTPMIDPDLEKSESTQQSKGEGLYPVLRAVEARS